MARRPSVPKIIIGKDLTVPLSRGPARVIDFVRSDEHELRVLLRLPNGDEVTRTLEWLVRTLQLENIEQAAPIQMPADDLKWNALSEQTRKQIEQRMEDLTLLLTGDRFGDIVDGTARGDQFIDPRFDPRELTLGQRYDRMSADIKARQRSGIAVLGGFAPDTLRNQLRLVRGTGDKRLLIHGNTDKPKKRPIPPEVQELIDDYVVNRVGGSRLSLTTHVTLLRKEVADAGLSGQISNQRLRDAFVRAGQGRGILQHSTTQQSKDGRPKRNRSGGWTGVTPFTWLEIDSTPINAIVIDQYGRVTTVTDILVAVCAISRKVAGLRLITSSNPYDSREVRGLLWDCVRGAIGPDKSALRALDLPQWVDINKPTPRNPTRFGSANTDRGPQFNCFGTINALKALGSHARINDPASGYQKPHVEAIHRTFDAFFQKLPGYKGPNTLDRGRHIERGSMMRVEDMLDLVHWFVDRIYHRREHSSLYHPDYPNRRWTPNDYFDLLIKGPGGRLSMNQDLSSALGLLETSTYALQPPGLFVEKRWYNSPELEALKDRHLGEKGRPGLRVQVWIDDRHPEFIYALPPNVSAPIAIRDSGSIAPKPPLADLLDRELRQAAGVEALYGSDRDQERAAVEATEQALIRVAEALAVKPEPGCKQRRPGKNAAQKDRAKPEISARSDGDVESVSNRRPPQTLAAARSTPTCSGADESADVFDRLLRERD